MMESKRLALLLSLMVLSDAFISHSPVQPRTRSPLSHTNQENQAQSSDSVTYEPWARESFTLDGSPKSHRMQDLVNNLTSSIDTGDSDSDALSDEECQDLLTILPNFGDIPIARELMDIAAVELFILAGCSKIAIQSAQHVSNVIDDEDLPMDMIQEFKDVWDNSLVKEEKATSKSPDETLGVKTNMTIQTINKLDTNIRNISAIARVFEGLQHEEEELGYVTCLWTETDSLKEHLCTIQESPMKYYDNNPVEFLVNAKLMCENMKDMCHGIKMINSLYYRLSDCKIGNENMNLYDASNSSLEESQYFIKNCSEKVNISINIEVGRNVESHVNRRSVSEEVTVQVYQDKNYKGRSRSLKGMVEHLKDDEVSSFTCPGDCTVIGFMQSSFLGRQFSYVGSTPDVGAMANYGGISSLIILPFKLTELCTKVYQVRYYWGGKLKLCGDQANITNVLVSSLKILCDGCSVIVYDGYFYSGKFKSFSSNVSFVGDEWNNRIKSIQIRPLKYENYEGQFHPGVLLYATRDDTKLVYSSEDSLGPVFNDRIFAVSCLISGCGLTLFEHNIFEGDSTVISTDGSKAALINDLRDRVSSVMVYMHKLCVTLYQHSQYRGSSKKICSDSGFIADFNDRTSSLIVECSFCSVIVYQHSDYIGHYKAFTGQVSYIGSFFNDRVSSIKIKPWKIEKYESERSCVNPEEQQAYNVIQWIPFVSLLYSLASSIYYGAANCKDGARERAIDMAIDIVMDAAVILTAGAAGPAALAGKTAAKLGVKAGTKIFFKAAKTAFKNAVKSGWKSSIKIVQRGLPGNLKSLLKASKALGSGIKSAFKKAPSVAKKAVARIADGARAVQKQGIKKSLKQAGKGIKNSGKRPIDDLAQSAKSQIDNADNVGKNIDSVKSVDLGAKSPVNCRRKRMIGAKCGNPRAIRAQNRAISSPRRQAAESFFKQVNEEQVYNKAISFSVPAGENFKVKDMLHNMQFYHDFVKRLDDAPVNMNIKMNIGGRPFEFTASPGRERQIYIGFKRNFAPDEKHSYDRIIRVLDSGDATKRKEIAGNILEAIDGSTSSNINVWKAMSPEEIESAQELIILTHVAESAVPEEAMVKKALAGEKGFKPNQVAGGVGGMDKNARGMIRKIRDDPENWSFDKVFNLKSGEFLIARDGGKKLTKQNLYKPSRDKTRDSVNSRHMSMSSASAHSERKKRFVGFF